MMSELFPAIAHDPIPLVPSKVFRTRKHLFEQEDIDAVRCALLTRRPLLLTGEPGTGKSQFAEAVATVKDCAYIAHVLDSRTEPRDLFYEIDHVRRLAEAQVTERRRSRRRLEIRNFIRPGPLWWAFSWNQAAGLPMAVKPGGAAHRSPERHRVLLLDEIDKVATDVANGLLEALGEKRFLGPSAEEIDLDSGVELLIILATNGERDLPDALVRRCLVHKLVLKTEGDNKEPRKFLERRGRANFDIEEAVLQEVITDFLQDRDCAQKSRVRKPGLAEFMDMLHVLEEGARLDAGRESPADKQKRWLEISRRFLFSKSEQLKVEE